MNPFEFPDAYDRCTLQGVLIPGLCRVDGAADIAKYDKVSGKGTTGVTKKYAGKDISDFTLEVLLWEPSHFTAFERDIRPLLRAAIPEGDEAPRAYSIEHPELVKLQILRITIDKVNTLKVVDQSGLYSYVLNVSKYAPAVAAAGGGLLRTKAAAAGENGKPGAAAQADPLGELKRMRDEAKSEFVAQGKKFWDG